MTNKEKATCMRKLMRLALIIDKHFIQLKKLEEDAQKINKKLGEFSRAFLRAGAIPYLTEKKIEGTKR